MTSYQSVYRITLLFALMASSWIEEVAAAIRPRYYLTDLGTLGGTDSGGLGINNRGQVTGFSLPSANTPDHAFLWSPSTPNGVSGTMQDLGTLGGQYSRGYGINDDGQVTGQYYTTGGDYGAFLYHGAMHDLGTLGGSYAGGFAINDSGQVTGESTTSGSIVPHAMLWTPATPGGTSGTMYDLGTLGGSQSNGYGINSSGQVTGFASTGGDVESHAFVWTPTISNGASGTMLDLGTLGGTISVGVGINLNGHVAGTSFTQDIEQHAFLYDGAMHDLGTLSGGQSFGAGINSRGHVVGIVDVPAFGARHAFLYTRNDGMKDLNTLIDPLSGWELIDASAINDVGQITGSGRIGGEIHAFLLTPVPEPLQKYRFAGGQFQFFNGDKWNITDGEISLQLFDVLVTEEGHERAVYGVTAFSIVAVDQLGASHSITAVPNGLPSPVFQDPYVPDIFLDIGLFNVYPEGNLDMLVYDLSIDGAPVDPFDTIGGPAFFGSEWLGSFPVPQSFSVSMIASLGSRNLYGDVTLYGALVPEPASAILCGLAVLGLVFPLGRRKSRCALGCRGLAVASIGLLISAEPTSAAMFNATSVAELISAIDAANQNAVPDTIALSPGTTFTLTEVNNTMHGATGLPTIAESAELTIVGNGSIIERSPAAGTPAFRLFDVADGASLALENLTLQGGLTGLEWAAYGGAIYNAGNLALNGVTVQNSFVRGRMGANCTRCRPGGNGGPGWPASGGGIYSGGALLLQNSMVLSNLAQGGPGGFGSPGGNRGRGGDGRGGGLFVAAGTATLRNSFVTGNSAQRSAGSPSGGGYGGGLFIADADVTLDEFTFAHVTSNTASTTNPNIFGPYEIVSDPNPLPGDYNNDGTVDAADYIVWRNGLGTTYTQSDYNVWRAHFGQTAGGGAALLSAQPLSTAVPEPGAISIAVISAACATFRFQRTNRRHRQAPHS